MNVSIDTGKVAHGGMAWKVGSVLDQATLLVSKGKQALAMKGIPEGTLPKKLYSVTKGPYKSKECGHSLEARDVGVL